MSDPVQDAQKKIGRSVRETFDRTTQVLSWDEYLARVGEDPYRETRTAYQLLRDAILFFRWREVKDCGRTFPEFDLFEDPFFQGRKRVVGQLRPIASLFKHIDACAKQEEDESIYILIGPPGTGKSRIYTLLEKGLEEYTRRPEGAVYTVNWLFREKFEEEGEEHLGFRALKDLAAETGSYAHLPEEEIFTRIECPLRDHPLALIPRVERNVFLAETVERRRTALRERAASDPAAARALAALDSLSIPHKILEVEPCRNCQNIRDRLIDLYGGDWAKVTKHIQATRVLFSLETGRGIAEVDPGVNVETELHPVVQDEAKVNLSFMLRGIRLFNFYGKPACANRGLLNYQDIFNKNHQQLQHLLSAVEEKTVDFGDVTQKIDYAIFGSTNLAESKLLEENVLTEGLRDRVEQIPVPYLLNYKHEEEIYAPNVHEILKSQHISPHTILSGALFVVLTRLADPKLDEYFEVEQQKLEKLQRDRGQYDARRTILTRQREALKNMTIIQKAKLYAGETAWIPQDLKELYSDAFVSAIREEHRGLEGKAGRSPRWLKRILGKLTKDDENICINPFQLYRAILESGGKEAASLLDAVQEEYNNIVLGEVEEALFEVREEDILRRVDLYLEHAKAYIKKEGVFDAFQKRAVNPEGYLNREEDFLEVEAAKRHEFRVGLIQKFGKAMLPDGKRPEARVAVPELVQRFRERIYLTVKRDFNYESFLITLDAFDLRATALFEDLDAARVEAGNKMMGEVFRVINNMRRLTRERALTAGRDEHAGYCNDCARKVLKYVLTNEKTRSYFRNFTK